MFGVGVVLVVVVVVVVVVVCWWVLVVWCCNVCFDIMDFCSFFGGMWIVNINDVFDCFLIVIGVGWVVFNCRVWDWDWFWLFDCLLFGLVIELGVLEVFFFCLCSEIVLLFFGFIDGDFFFFWGCEVIVEFVDFVLLFWVLFFIDLLCVLVFFIFISLLLFMLMFELFCFLIFGVIVL